MPIIQVDHLTKEYRLGAMPGLKQTQINGAARLSGKKIETPVLFNPESSVGMQVGANLFAHPAQNVGRHEPSRVR
jgi:hypothetical protein